MRDEAVVSTQSTGVNLGLQKRFVTCRGQTMSSLFLLVLVLFSHGPLFLSASALESLSKGIVRENIDLYIFDAETFCKNYPPLVPIQHSSEKGEQAYVCSWGNSSVGFAFLSTNPNQLSCSSSGCFGRIVFDPSQVQGFSFTIRVPPGKEVMMYPGKARVELLWLGSKHCTGIQSFNVSIPTQLGLNVKVGKVWLELAPRGSMGIDSLSTFFDLDVSAPTVLPDSITILADLKHNAETHRNCSGVSNYTLGPLYSWIRFSGFIRTYPGIYVKNSSTGSSPSLFGGSMSGTGGSIPNLFGGSVGGSTGSGQYGGSMGGSTGSSPSLFGGSMGGSSGLSLFGAPNNI
eukprot:TRINITY_DN6174_c0_g1_i4.p1 TRINITY_DN6174_c0_g1~~TRINITY_DN6174_c0_g1_i4.p1  ORF type:complete len:389 (-),score=48.58 TRINITY_DN6174_c0_g1_i4:96-1130(-)